MSFEPSRVARESHSAGGYIDRTIGSDEPYDLAADPCETANFANDRLPRRREMG